jgi:hypothetical protein
MSMKSMKIVLTILVLAMGIGAANAQLSATGTTPITALKAESMSISASGLVQYDISALAPQTLNISSTWNLKPQRNGVNVCVYMDSATGTMKGSVGNANVIDQTMVQTKVGAGAFANINAGAGCGVAGGVTVVKTYSLTTAAQRNLATPNADTVQVQLNAIPATYEADTYTGTLTVVAYAL